jgi:hypothetical protein
MQHQKRLLYHYWSTKWSKVIPLNLIFSFAIFAVAFIGMWCICSKLFLLRGASHYGRGIEMTLDKLCLRRQDIIPLKYINCGVCISLEKNLSTWREFGFP